MSLDKVREAEDTENEGHYHHQSEGHAHYDQDYCIGRDVGVVGGWGQRDVAGHGGEGGEV